ncbi:Bud site selection protein 3-like protein [Yarrowia sp. C11]|nr:Bud site selection protein 3-like protein [Yarrowia sp. E02]KAG5365390.1 Bud site selection protein 3-like protein [Yarrowia sp. C11]
MIGTDPLFGPILGIVYKTGRSHSCVIISRHGASGFVDMTLSHKSRYYGAVKNLEDKSSAVSRALGIALLRSYVTMDKNIRTYLAKNALQTSFLYDYDETCAGKTASSLVVGDGHGPEAIGKLVLESGVVEPKFVRSSAVDIVYEDSDETIEDNNRLVYLLGEQLEQLFDPLSEYSPEGVEEVYEPPREDEVRPPSSSTEEGDNNEEEHDPESQSPKKTFSDSATLTSVCYELITIQSNFRDALISFLQSYLIPLRIQVINGAIPSLNMTKLNSIFPPTIDEIARIHNLFQTALKAATPFGSSEIVRATGMTLPYFYKPCMRHEAALRSFSDLYGDYSALIAESGFMPPVPYSQQRIQSVLSASQNLTKIKLLLDRIVKLSNWGEKHDATMMYYHAAVNTIESFARVENNVVYDKRVFTPTGKILVEFASGWPRELQYGWINRRVVSIFDVTDVFAREEQSGKAQTRAPSILIIFTDHILLLEVEASYSTAIKSQAQKRAASGVSFHSVSIADMLMHSLINEVAVPQIPQLSVKFWAPISQVFASEYNFGHNLSLFAVGGFNTAESGNEGVIPTSLENPTGGSGSSTTTLLFTLKNPVAPKIVELCTKAKIMSKTQPFHLFHHQKTHGLNLFMTVHEMQGYMSEQRKSPIAIFLNVDGADGKQLARDLTKRHDLDAAFSISLQQNETAHVTLYSKFAYTLDRRVTLDLLANFINTEVSNLYTLFLSPANPDMVESIVQGNEMVAQQLVDYATRSASAKTAKTAKPVPSKSMIDDSALVVTGVSKPVQGVHAKPPAAAKTAKTVAKPAKASPSLKSKKSVLSLLGKSPKPGQNSPVPELNRKDSMWMKLKGKLKSPSLREEDEDEEEGEVHSRVPEVSKKINVPPPVPVVPPTGEMHGLGISSKTPEMTGETFGAGETPRATQDNDPDATPKVVRRKKSFAALRRGIQTNSDEEDEAEVGYGDIDNLRVNSESTYGGSNTRAVSGVSGVSDATRAVSGVSSNYRNFSGIQGVTGDPRAAAESRASSGVSGPRPLPVPESTFNSSSGYNSSSVAANTTASGIYDPTGVYSNSSVSGAQYDASTRAIHNNTTSSSGYTNPVDALGVFGAPIASTRGSIIVTDSSAVNTSNSQPGITSTGSIRPIKKEASHPVFETNPQLPTSHSHYYTYSGSESEGHNLSNQRHTWNDSYDSELMGGGAGHGRNISSLESLDCGESRDASDTHASRDSRNDVKLFDFIKTNRSSAADPDEVSEFSSFHSSEDSGSYEHRFADDSRDFMAESRDQSRVYPYNQSHDQSGYYDQSREFMADSMSDIQAARNYLASRDSDESRDFMVDSSRDFLPGSSRDILPADATRQTRHMKSSSMAQFKYPPPLAPLASENQLDAEFSSFSYLAGILQGKVALGEEDGKSLEATHARQTSKSARVYSRNPVDTSHVPASDSFSSSIESGSTGALYPDLRDSSIMFLGKYVRDKSPVKGQKKKGWTDEYD